MSLVKYFIRLDDACPTMDSRKWTAIERILDKYNIKPLVGIVPNNKDYQLMFDSPDNSFWAKAREWQNKGWSIALHGYDHVYLSSSGGINPFWNRSEFAGVPIDIQKLKIKEGISILAKNHIKAEYFFAPSHTFDENTLKALRSESDIKKISDTFTLSPYKRLGFSFFPQQFGGFKNIIIPGYWTFCFHPNTMSDEGISAFERFIQLYRNRFCDFSEFNNLSLQEKMSYLDKLINNIALKYKTRTGH